MPTQQQILICQHTACRKSGAKAIFKEFQHLTPSHILVKAVGCFGKCGRGPTVVILPAEIWYSHIQQGQVTRIIEKLHYEHDCYID